jgi:DNA repair protein RadA/Sms
LGKCPDCDAWNSFHEEVTATGRDLDPHGIAQPTLAITATPTITRRTTTGLEELDRVFGGGGIVEGSLLLMSGEPGIGKSTLTLKICESLATNPSGKKALYVSGEESAAQIAMRAGRMGIRNENIDLVSETNLENILATVEETKPGFLIIDSIQVISSAVMPSIAGSINQVRFCTEAFMHLAKKSGLTVMIVGHVTKDGNLAGPKILEHLVDTVVLIEGERFQNLRIVRCLKNRFGSTNEVGLFEMTETGLKEVKNASRLFLEGRKEDGFGSAITAVVEGTRPFLVEVQALTSTTTFGYPRRNASGYDINRLQLIIAVIQKHLNFNLQNQDVFINVVGGFRLNEPAADLAVAAAIISSLKQEPLPAGTVYLGEIGLSGELRAINHLEKRIAEAAKIGFDTICIPVTAEKTVTAKIKVNRFKDLASVIGPVAVSRAHKSPRKPFPSDPAVFTPDLLPENEIPSRHFQS